MPAAKYLFDYGEYLGNTDGYLCKTHFPFLQEKREHLDLSVSKCILLFRNPIECVYSMFHLIMLENHIKKQSREKHINSPEFVEIIKDLTDRWAHFHETWLEMKDIPTYWVTYESFLANPVVSLLKMFSLAIGEHLEGSELHKKIIAHVEEKGMASAYLNKPVPKETPYSFMPKVLTEYIYKKCFKFLVQGGWVHDYEKTLGLELTDIEKEKEKLNLEERNRVLFNKIQEHQLVLPEKPFLIHTTKETKDEPFEALRLRIKAFKKFE